MNPFLLADQLTGGGEVDLPASTASELGTFPLKSRFASTRDDENIAVPRRRQLPQVNAKPNVLRKANSMSFLPTSTGDVGNGRRRRLPDPAQGRLVEQVATKLKEEAKLRLEISSELQEEKRRRWKAEDALAAQQKRMTELTFQLEERRRQLQDLRVHFEDERTRRAATDAELKSSATELRRARAELGRLREEHVAIVAESTKGEEEMLTAWEATLNEKRRRQEAEEKLEAITSRLLAMGGVEALEQLLDTPQSSSSPSNQIKTIVRDF